MATLAIAPLRFYQGNPPRMERETIIAGFVEGQLLIKTNNVMAACGADPTYVSHVCPTISANVIPGNTLVMDLPVVLPGQIWEATLYSATLASAVFAEADLDTPADYGAISATVSGITCWMVDKDETSTKVFRVIGRAPTSSATDLYPRVYVQFLAAVCSQA